MEALKRHVEGTTQSEAAKRLGISRSYLAELLAGTKLPGRKTMEKIEKATAGAVPITAWFD